MKAIQALLLGVAALALGGVPALAGGESGAAQSIGLPQAAAIAEAHAEGKALHAERTYREGRLVYRVRVMRPGSIVWVSVDSRDGEVVRGAADRTRQG